MNCKTCLYWNKDEKESNRTAINVGTCDKEASQLYGNDMIATKMTILCGHDGTIYTGEYFGCVHYSNNKK